MDDSMLEFAQNYESVFKPKFTQKVDEFFNSLVKESGINADENRKTSGEYRTAADNADRLNRKIGSMKGWRGFMIVMAVLCFVTTVIMGILFFVNNDSEPSTLRTFLIVGIVCLVVGIALVIIVVKVFNKKIKALSAQHTQAQSTADSLYCDCMTQVAPLHKLLWRTKLYEIIEETLPTFKFDKNFNMKRFDYLHGKFGLSENTDPDQSTVGLISGEILGNPFVEERRFRMTMGTETYTGSIVISWTETYRDNEGHTRTRMRTETLVATLQKPKPYYDFVTRLVFGSEAAPDLSFSHQPTHAERLSENKLKSKVRRDARALQKQARKAATTGEGNFTEMANQEFDALFNAEDRDNEVQFRLLFTPLAQKNMLYLMKMPQPYGDDFDFTKSKMLNFITSEHGQHWQIDEDNSRYMVYDVDLCAHNLKEYYLHFFQNMFFELAPIMAIPLYQQHKTKEYIYSTQYERNFTSFESEVLANCFDESLFAPPESETNVILKTSLMRKGHNVDQLKVDAYGFRTEKHVEYVTKFGGDGKMHEIPVEWVEYIPVQRATSMDLTEENGTCGGSNKLSKHGLAASYLGDL